MSFGRFRLIPCAALALTALTLAGSPVGAQGFFDTLFGGAPRPRQNIPPQNIPPQANAYSDPANPSDRPVYSPFGATPPAASSGTGRAVAYCVRLCDGRYFPIQRHANANPAQLCSSFCPAAKTQVYNGSQIDHATAGNGARYADLDNAFIYRQKIVDGCTCNGKDSFGVARIDVASDPTLRPGDIVATGDNVKAALLAMAASKERLPAREAVNEKPTTRPGVVRRVAGPAGAAPAEPEPDQTDSIPED